jgi:hypothetical protein
MLQGSRDMNISQAASNFHEKSSKFLSKLRNLGAFGKIQDFLGIFRIFFRRKEIKIWIDNVNFDD